MLHRIAYDPEGWVFLRRFAWVPTFFLVFIQRVVVDEVGIKNKRKQMSDDESETIYSESEMSEDSQSECSIADFVADDSEALEVCVSCRAEICPSNEITKKRRHVEVSHESGSNAEGGSDDEGDEDSSSDYVPSEGGESSSEADTSSEDE